MAVGTTDNKRTVFPAVLCTRGDDMTAYTLLDAMQRFYEAGGHKDDFWDYWCDEYHFVRIDMYSDGGGGYCKAVPQPDGTFEMEVYEI